MKKTICALLALLGCATASAQSNFVGNPYLPYPAACARAPEGDAHGWLETHAVQFHTSVLRLLDYLSGDWIDIEFSAWRAHCSEPGRAPVWLEFALPDSSRKSPVEFRLPDVYVIRPGGIYVPMHLAEQPGGWALGDEAEADARLLVSESRGSVDLDFDGDTGVRRWVFVLENFSPLSEWWGYDPYLLAAEYNAAFNLRLHITSQLTIAVPAAFDLFPQPAVTLPLSGRLSGTWVIEGAADQGFVLSISDRVALDRTDRSARENPPLVAFLAHYTFDGNGDPLWLTGVGEFVAGDSEVTLDMLRVTDGRFRTGLPAVREVVGSVTLRANSCDDITFEYDYSVLGLGAGSRRLQRLYALEIAGFDCRDYEARMAANP